MLHRLPERIWPFRMARGGESVTAREPVANLPRLRALLADGEDEASIRLQFRTDDAGRPRVDGRISANLSLICQRCLRPVVMGVSSEVHLALVKSDADCQRVEAPYEPCLVAEESLSLRQLVEDELLLALPIVALHADDVCEAPRLSGSDPVASEREHPFAVLKGLANRD